MFALAHQAVNWVAPFLFVLTLIVTVHELGHFLVARSFGVAIDSFSLGFGPALVSWRDRGGVVWRIGWVPLGGYVKFAGDENAASVPDAEDLAELRRAIIASQGPAAVRRYYHFKPIWQRALIAAAGPAANFLLAIGLFAIVLGTVGRPIEPARVGTVVPGSAAAAAGLRPGDLIVSVDGHALAAFDELAAMVRSHPGVPLTLSVRRGEANLILVATPTREMIKDELGRSAPGGKLGVASDPTASGGRLRQHYGPIEAIGAGAAMSWDVLKLTIEALGEMIQGHISPSNLSGPLGIAQATHAVAKAGAAGAHGLGDEIIGVAANLLSFTAFISVNIGFMNLMPIPVLDGGHLLFYAYEAVARRPVAAAVQAVGFRVGLALLLGLMLFATTNDLLRSSFFHFLGGPLS